MVKAVVEKGKWVVIDIAQIPLKSTKKFRVLAVWLYCLIPGRCRGLIRATKKGRYLLEKYQPHY
jgi:hypothetical protein